MKARIAFLVVVLVAGLGLAAWLGLRGGPAGPRTAPEFVLPDVDGQVIRLRELRGRVVVLNVWATWCPPCVEEMPTLEALWRHFRDEDFVVLAPSQDEDPDGVGPWVKRHGLTFPVLLDPRGEIGHHYGVTGYPETFVIDREGRIVHHHIGYRDWADPEILAAVERLLETGEWPGLERVEDGPFISR